MMLLKEAVLDALKDTMTILPILFIIYFLLELLEHRFSHKALSGPYIGPVVGSAVGIIPQCGFSIAATTLFNKRAITMGTLLAVYLATSDEAIPILLAHPQQLPVVVKIIVFKFIIGLAAGLLIDGFIKKPVADSCYCSDCHEDHHEDHEHHHDHEKHHHDRRLDIILKHSIKKTLQIFLFLLVIIWLLNWIILFIGQDQLERFISTNSVMQPFLCSLIGLIPTCVPSILITQLFLSGILPFGSTMAGLCAGSGMGILLLFRENKDPKQITQIILLLYFISAFSGLLLNQMK